MWAPLVNVNHLWLVPVKCWARSAQWPAGLLVLPLAGQERRHVDVLDERVRIEFVGHRRVIRRVGFDLLHQVRRLAVQRLVGGARLIAFFDARVRPCLTVPGAGRFGVLLALLRPRHREARVQDAARVERRRRGVDHRQRRDRREVRRLLLCREQLADPAVGDAEHAHLVAEHPRLVCDRLDHVVAIEVLHVFKEVKGAARAAGSPHVHVDYGEAHQVGKHRDAVFRTRRVRVPVARVLDDRRVGSRVARRRHPRYRKRRKMKARRDAWLACRTARRVHVDRQFCAVACLQVRVAVVGDRLVVDARVPRCRRIGVNRDRFGGFPCGGDADLVVLAWLHFPEQHASKRVRVLRGDGRVLFQQRHLGVRRQAGRVHLFGAALRGEGRRARRRHQPENKHCERRGQTDPRAAPARRSCGQPASLTGTAHDPTTATRWIGTQHFSPIPAPTRRSS